MQRIGSYVGAVLALFGLSGCAGSFEEARLVSGQVGAVTDANRERCQSLDDRKVVWGGIAKGSAVLAGASGLTAIPVDDHDAEAGLVAGAVVFSALAATSVYVSESAGVSWVEECR